MIKYFKPNIEISYNFILPFTGLSKNGTEMFSPVNTYMACDAIEESITDYKLLVLYKHASTQPWERWEKENLMTNSLVENNYNTEDGSLYVFNLIQYRDTIDKILNGEYTKIKEEDKKIIWKYGFLGLKEGVTIDFFKNPENFGEGTDLFLISSLYFHEFKVKVAKDMVGVYYTTLREAKEALKDMKEICPIFDLDKETLNTELV